MELRCIPHDVVDSTSERAFAALAAGIARHGDVHTAREQTAGRGRFGRRWYSPAGEGLYLSVILLPDPPPWEGPLLTIAAGLAIHDAAHELGCSTARLEWPNDVVVDGAKLAGVLVETRGLDPARPHYVVGIGLNVVQREFARELALERAVTSLRASGLDVSIDAARASVLAHLGRRFDQIAHAREQLARDYLDATGLQDRRVIVRTANREHHGVIAALSLVESALELRDDERMTRIPLGFVRDLVASSNVQ